MSHTTAAVAAAATVIWELVRLRDKIGDFGDRPLDADTARQTEIQAWAWVEASATARPAPMLLCLAHCQEQGSSTTQPEGQQAPFDVNGSWVIPRQMSNPKPAPQ